MSKSAVEQTIKLFQRYLKSEKGDVKEAMIKAGLSLNDIKNLTASTDLDMGVPIDLIVNAMRSSETENSVTTAMHQIRSGQRPTGTNNNLSTEAQAIINEMKKLRGER